MDVAGRKNAGHEEGIETVDDGLDDEDEAVLFDKRGDE